MATNVATGVNCASGGPIVTSEEKSPLLREPGRWENKPSPFAPQEESRIPSEEMSEDLTCQQESRPGQPNATGEARVMTDTAGQIIMANCEALRILEPAELFLRRMTCNMLFGEGVDCPHTTLSKERSLIEREIPSRASDRLLNIRASSLSDSNGRVRGFLHSIKVTRERVLERQLIEAGRLSLAAMTASSVAHEVATPLSVIANIAEMLMMDCERDSATATSLRKIVSQARRVADMMREILNFIRERPVNFGAIDMSALVRETLDLIEYQLTESHIQVSVECSMDTSLIWGDRAQLRQVLLSVIATASQAMKNGGLLRVRICEGAVLNMPRPSVLITVEDTGRGMLAPAIERVFDNSFTTKTAEGGRNLAWLSRSE